METKTAAKTVETATAFYCDGSQLKRTWYVSHLPGQDGVDWGWTFEPSKAIRLSVYWQRRFAADMELCGRRYFGFGR